MFLIIVAIFSLVQALVQSLDDGQKNTLLILKIGVGCSWLSQCYREEKMITIRIINHHKELQDGAGVGGAVRWPML